MTGTDAMAQVKARMAQIEARFGVNRPPRATATSSSNGDFQAALAAAQSQLGGGSSVPGLGVGNVSGADVVQGSLKYLGVPYKWGGTDPATGLDCSGFVQQVYEDLGIALPRVSQDQAKAGTPVADLSQAKPGDLVAFGTPVDHIGIYVGNGRMIEAPHTGDVVKIADVPSDWTAIRRILPDPAATASLAGASPYASLFEASAAKHNVSASVLQAMAKAESGFDPNAVSKAGAQGLMQLRPGTAKGLGVNPFDPAQAIDGAASLLAGNLKRFGSLDQALAAYNAGPAAVQRYGGVPPYAETQGYVRRILSDLRTEVS
jgi:hypothetical protein